MNKMIAIIGSFFLTLFPSSAPADLTMTTAPLDSSVLGVADESLVFRVNIPAIFSEAISAPNVVYSLKAGNGIKITNGTGSDSGSGSPTISTDAFTSLIAGTGITVEGNKITSTITQGYTSLEAGSGISVDGNKITNTLSIPTPDYTQSGWTRTGTTVGLTTLNDSVTVATLTAGAVSVDSLTTGGLSLTSDLTVASGHSLLPAIDLGSDIGTSSHRFNNLWVANINSNSSQSFSGQTTFSYPPQDTTIDEASVLINPTSSFANGQLLGLGIAGYQRAVIDEDGDIILGYNSLTSAPATDYPLDIYGHSGTRVFYTDTAGRFGSASLNIGDGTGNFAGLKTIQTDGTALSIVTNNAERFRVSGSFAFSNVNMGIGYSSGTGALNVNGNVGIGTTSPGYKLDVNGQINGKAFGGGGVSLSGYTTLYADANGVQLGDIANAFSGTRIYGGGVEAIRIISGGNVGIGTTSPGVPLHVNGAMKSDSLYTGYLLSGSASNTYIGLNGITSIDNNIYNTSAKYTVNVTGGNNLMTILGTGNVGIGTTSPTGLLHIGNGQYAGDFANPAITIGSSLNGFYLDTSRLIVKAGNSFSGMFTSTGLEGNGATGYRLLSTSPETNISPLFVLNKSDTNTGVGGSLGVISLITNLTSRLFISNSGNVGIGTTSPTQKLEINGSLRIAYNQKLYGGSDGIDSYVELYNGSTGNMTFNTHDSNKNFIFQNGKIGIGTTSPQEALHVSGNIRFDSQLRDNQGNGVVTQSAVGLTNGRILTIGNSTYGTTILSGGNVGIGTTSPGKPLDVVGNARISGILYNTYLWGDSGNPLYLGSNAGSRWVIDTGGYGGPMGSLHPTTGNSYDIGSATNPVGNVYASGNVGIGTTSPGAKLNVYKPVASFADGSPEFSVFDGVYNFNMGYDAKAIGSNYLSFYRNTSHTFMNSSAGNTYIQSGGASLMTLLSGGNVGIGTTSPSTHKLEVVGTTGLGAYYVDKASYTIRGIFQHGGNASGIANSGGLQIAAQPTSEATNGSGDIGFFTASANSAGALTDATLSEKMTIKYDGNVGIGTTSPGYKFQVQGVYSDLYFDGGTTAILGTNYGSGASISLYNASTGQMAISSYAGTLFNTNGSTRMIINNSGNVGIGTTAPGSFTGGFNNLVVGSGSGANGMTIYSDINNAGSIAFANSATGSNAFDGLIYYNQASDGMYFSVAESGTVNNVADKYFMLNSAGNVGIGTTTPGYKLQVGNAGDGSEARANAWNALSDSTFKTNITPLSGSLDKIMQLEGVSFAWKSNGKENLGLIAQDVQRVFPELIATDSDGVLSLNYDGLSAPIIAAIKEQQTQIDDLRGDSLKVEVDGISALVGALENLIREIGDKVSALSVKFTTKESHQEKLCVGTEDDEICLSKDQIKAVIDNLPSPTATASASPSATPEPSPSPSIEPSPSASESASPSSSPSP